MSHLSKRTFVVGRSVSRWARMCFPLKEDAMKSEWELGCINTNSRRISYDQLW